MDGVDIDKVHRLRMLAPLLRQRKGPAVTGPLNGDLTKVSSSIVQKRALAADPDPIATWVDVTPELAAEWLKRNTLNRRKKPANIKRFTADMLAGQWKKTGATVQFGKSGRLVDGQNRLQSMIDSGVTVRLLIVDGVDDEIFDVTDTGAKRTGADALHIEGYEGFIGQCGAAAAAIAMSMSAGHMPYSDNFTNQDIRKFANTTALMNSVGFIAELPRKGVPLVHSAGAALHFFMAQKNVELADEFMRQLYSGEGLTSGMVLNLRNNLIGRVIQSGSSRSGNLAAIGAVIKVWNALRSDRQIKHIGNAFVGSGESFPKIK